MRAVLYCRVSDQKQVDSLSLPTQEATCRAYCAREGYEVDRVFIERGETAKTADRPEFQALLTYCRERKRDVHAVVVYSLNRFSRNVTDHHAIAALLRGMGISLRSATEPIDDTPAGRFMEGVLSAVAQFDNDVRSARVRDGMQASRQRGRFIHVAPTGYVNAARQKRGPSLVIDPVRGPLVRRAFEMIAAGESVTTVWKRLARLGLTLRSGRQVGRNTFYELLRKRVYTGMLHVGDDRWEPGDFEALIPDTLFERVQQRLAPGAKPQMGHPKQRINADFPLRRFVRCATCGSALAGSWSTGRGGRRYAFYHCLKGHVRTARLALDDAWLALLERTRPQQEYLALLRQLVLNGWDETLKAARSERQSVQQRLAALQARLDRVDEAWLYEKSIDETTYLDQRDKLRQSITLAKMDLGVAEIEEFDVRGALDYAEHVMRDSSRLWTDAAPLRRWQLQWALFPKGLSWDGRAFGTAITALAYYQLVPTNGADYGVVDQAGLGWNHIAPDWTQLLGWLRHMNADRQAA